MISLVAVALAVVLSQLLLDGSQLDLGLAVVAVAPATLALAVGLGMLVCVRLPVLACCGALAVLVLLRGAVAGWVGASMPGDASSVLAAVLSLAPIGLMLGRILSSLTGARGTILALGWVLGELLVMTGVGSYLPGPWSGLLFAIVFAGLFKVRSKRAEPADEAADPESRLAWEGVPFGFAAGILWLTIRRVVPGYATPPVHAGSEVALALLLPAIVVAWPASVLASGSAGRRVLRAVGFLAIGYASWKLAQSLDLFRTSAQYVAVQTEIRQTAVRWGAPVTEWRGWLLMFCGLSAAGVGVVLGCLGKAARAPFVLGLGAALAAQLWVLEESALGPQQLLVAAAGVAAVAALSGWRRLALVAVPAGVAAAAFIPASVESSYEGIRRVGEPGVESTERQLAADVMVYSSGGPDITAQQARRTYGTTFTERVPLGEVLELRGEAWASAHSHGDDPEPLPIPLLAPLDEDGDADTDVREMQKHYGIRFAGVPAHPGHDPMGPEGSLGRLCRLFQVPGRCFVTGIGSEFIGGDLLDAGIANAVEVSSALPMGLRNQRVLFALIGSIGLGLDVDPDPLHAARVALERSCSMVVIAPERVEWPGSGIVSTKESLARCAELIAPGGRCLLWLDTTSMDARTLRSQVAAFGDVFGASSAAFVEMRELSPPFVLLLGWVDESGQPRADELQGRIPGFDETGLRTRLWSLDDLGAMVLLDGDGIAGLAASSPALRRSAPSAPSSFAAGGWEAVRGLLGGSRRLDRIVEGAEVAPHDLTDVAEGLAAHARYHYDLVPMSGAMLVEVVDDVDWDAFEREVAHYERAAGVDPENPLLHHALAGLLGPLARFGDATRFAEVYKATGAGRMRSWRLAAQEAHVRRAGLQEREADAALERARQWAPWAAGAAAGDHDHDH